MKLLSEPCILVDQNDKNIGTASKKTCHLLDNINNGNSLENPTDDTKYLDTNLGKQCSWSSLIRVYMSRNMTKPTKWLCAQQRLRSAWASAQFDQSLCCPHEESLGPYLPVSAQQRLRSDWADAQADLSLRWAHAHLLVLSCRGSHCLPFHLHLLDALFYIVHILR